MIKVLRKRRSIRKFLKDKIPARLLKLLEEALLRAPSSRDIQPCQFVFITDSVTLRLLSKSKLHGSAFLANAPLGIVVCGDETRSDVWVEDCSIAAILAQIAATSCGLGSCWIQIRNRTLSATQSSEQYIQKLLSIPSHIRVETILAIGFPAQAKKPIQKTHLKKSHLHYNVFISSDK